jgi:menaquinone-dependent protoporphyrinogen oxidase
MKLSRISNSVLYFTICITALFSIANGAGMKNVLIVYGSFAGSTAEVADSMKSSLTEKGCVVQTQPAEGSQTDLSKFDLVIIGSAIQGDKIHPKIKCFIDANRSSLNQKKVAIFVVCITITSSNPKKREHALSTYPDKVACGLNPISKTVFAGKAPSGGWFVNWMGKMIFGIIPGDFRDWNKVKGWTSGLV